MRTRIVMRGQPNGWMVGGKISLAVSLVFLIFSEDLSSTDPSSPTKTRRIKEQVGATSLLEVVSWTRPQTDWLYILDSNGGQETSQIVLFDPDQSRVVGTIRAGYDPDMVLSEDGRLLYVASGDSWLSAVDTQSGSILYEVPFPDRAKYPALLSISGLALAPGDKRLYVRKMRSLDDGRDIHSVGVFDTTSQFFVGEVSLTQVCGVARILPGPAADDLLVFCHTASALHRIKLETMNSAASIELIGLPPEGSPSNKLEFGNPQQRIVIAWSPDGRSITALAGDGTLYQMDAQLKATSRHIQVPLAERALLPWAVAWPPTDNRLFVGSASVYRTTGTQVRTRTKGEADEIHIFDSHNWNHLSTIRTSGRFWTLAVSNDGTRVYAPTGPWNSSILIIDGISYTEIGSIQGVGTTPCFVLVAP